MEMDKKVIVKYINNFLMASLLTYTQQSHTYTLSCTFATQLDMIEEIPLNIGKCLEYNFEDGGIASSYCCKCTLKYSHFFFLVRNNKC